ncbi:MAG: DUF1365 domain-containing protein [Nitrobacter sp.]
MTLRSSLYVGSIMHRRLRPPTHQFRYRAFWFLIDLDELADLSNKLKWFSYNRPNVFSFYDADHGDGSITPLRVQIEQQMVKAGINIAGGQIRLLCMPRTLGYCFNPLSIFFCYRADAVLAALVYQVHNTFGERHSYVIRIDHAKDARHQCCRKLFYVSPFLDMDMRYDFRITGPDERITVGICARKSTGPVLNAVMTGARQSLTDRDLMLVFLKSPAISIKVIAAIYWEALRLWAKGIRLRRRPLPPEQATTIVTAAPEILD